MLKKDSIVSLEVKFNSLKKQRSLTSPFRGRELAPSPRRCEAHGLIARAVFGDRVCLCPPLIITEEQVREMIRRFTAALDDTLEWVRA
jgi:adenosylmethionine-8-amino-7-oxononanoate aminotransferase